MRYPFAKKNNPALPTLLVLGIVCLGAAVLFIAWPELVAYLASLFFIFIGLASVSLAIRFYLLERRIRKTLRHFSDDITDSVRGMRDWFEEW